MSDEKVMWRGTHGVGDFMNALNCCYRYSYDEDKIINLEMHWEHDEDFLYHPDDPETIIDRMNFIHPKYFESERVEVTHVFNSKEFYYEDSEFKQKRRYLFESNRYKPTGAPPNDWLFSEEEFIPVQQNKIVMWTPHYNREPPRPWKRQLTSDDWYDIIQLLLGEGWILQEVTYRTSIEEAYKHIQEAKYVVSYDGMWHFISKNFGKPHIIPSEEGMTTYNTPAAVKVHFGDDFKKCFQVENQEETFRKMREHASRWKEDIAGNLNNFEKKI